MKTATISPALQAKRSALMAGASAALAIAAFGFSGVADARDNVSFSVGIGVPGVQLGVSNAYPVYQYPQQVYVQPATIYAQPAPVYVQPAPIYYRPAPVYLRPAPVYVQPRPYYQSYYYGQPQVVYVKPGYRHGGYKKHGRDHDDDD